MLCCIIHYRVKVFGSENLFAASDVYKRQVLLLCNFEQFICLCPYKASSVDAKEAFQHATTIVFSILDIIIQQLWFQSGFGSRSGLTIPLSRHSVGTYSETSSHATCQGTFGHSRLSSLSHYGLILA